MFSGLSSLGYTGTRDRVLSYCDHNVTGQNYLNMTTDLVS